MSMLLPIGVAWIGFDATGLSIAASIETRKPSTRKGSVMEGCARVAKCRLKDDNTIFGRDISDFEILENRK